jgi:2-oxoisovalerate dehydrogenase E1 component
MKAVLNDRDTQLVEGLNRDQLLAVHRVMLLSRKLDDKEIQLKGQSQIFFQISGAGHEAVLAAAGQTLRSGYDWFYPYYRDRALCLHLGVTPLEMLLASVGAKDDPASGGRQMPSHWGHTTYNIVSGSSPTGTQVLQAVGAAEAGVIYSRVTQIPDRESRFKPDEITYVSLGEGATSEGEFWEALNATCAKQLPVLFLVEDNGYAISVPVEVQTAGGDISRLVRGFPGLHVDSIDGTDFFASLRAMREATAYVRARRGPAFVHARCIRPYSHSLSDDEKLYKPPAEREAEAKRDPIVRFTEFLKKNGIATDEELAALAADVEREVNAAALQALAAPKPAKNTAEMWLYSPDVDPSSAAFETPAHP